MARPEPNMGWVFIDTARPDGFRLGILDDSGRIVSREGRSHRVLIELARRIPAAKWPDISGICVVQGPGSFTSIRTGVLIANVLSRLHAKPLVGISVEQSQDLRALSRMLSAGLFEPATMVLPVYDAEPNITLPKHAC